VSVWFCTTVIPLAEGGAVHRKLYIRADRWHDAQAWARRQFQTDSVECVRSGQDCADWEIRFVGNDFNHGSSIEHFRMQVRQIKQGGWTEWEDA